MTNEAKCYRCGTVIPNNGQKVIVCPHCGGRMIFDETTQKRLKYIRYALVSVIMILILIVLQTAAKTKDYMVFAIVLIMLVLFSNYSEKSCSWILRKTFGISYMEAPKNDSRGNKK
ncbi:MAG: hypothetical protein EOM64_05205 [Erysipelotrichia bacterium]|nr:hypothetical protein [Erysipelotrichia bacterium]